MTLIEAKATNPNAILIHSGVLFDVFNPKKEDINIIDIAHGLSNICRYGGHSPKFYSVAQHSVLCSLQDGTLQEQLECLLHDSTETVVGDLPTPIKKNMPEYVKIEDNLMSIISEKFNLSFPLTENTHRVDRLILEFEYKNFFEEPNEDFEFWKPEEAKSKFLNRFYELNNQILDKISKLS